MSLAEGASFLILFICFLCSDLQKLPWSSGRLYPEESIVHANANVNIDARQWLHLRVKIASFLCSLIKMPIGDQPKITENAIGTFEYHVTQGVEEAEAFNDEETFCKLKMLSIQNSIQCGEDIDRIINDLKVLIMLFTEYVNKPFRKGVKSTNQNIITYRCSHQSHFHSYLVNIINKLFSLFSFTECHQENDVI